MAIIGAGNPVGGSFTGPAEALEIIGDHAYAYSGDFIESTTPITVLDFTTGNYYFVGVIQLLAPVQATNPVSGATTTGLTTFNGVNVIQQKAVSDPENSPNYSTIQIIIPPYTEVSTVVESTADDTAQKGSMIITGRIYRTRD